MSNGNGNGNGGWLRGQIANALIGLLLLAVGALGTLVRSLDARADTAERNDAVFVVELRGINEKLAEINRKLDAMPVNGLTKSDRDRLLNIEDAVERANCALAGNRGPACS